MKLCERCETYDAIPVVIKDSESVGVYMQGTESASAGRTFFFPTEEGKFCYYCEKVMSGRINVKEVKSLTDN